MSDEILRYRKNKDPGKIDASIKTHSLSVAGAKR